MHPLIARYLDFSALQAALENGLADEPDIAALHQIVKSHPQLRTAVQQAKSQKQPSTETQHQLIILCARAALLRMSESPAFTTKLTTAKAALLAEGATAAEADNLLVQAVLDEAFGYAGDPNEFDEPYLGETLDSLSHLAQVTQESVDDWLEEFANQGVAVQRPLRLAAAEVTLESAWGDGPQPISPEHIDDALENLADRVAATDFQRGSELMAEFLAFLEQRRVVGALRCQRLTHVLRAAAAVGPLTQEDDDESDDDV